MALTQETLEQYPCLKKLFSSIPMEEIETIELTSFKKGVSVLRPGKIQDAAILVVEGLADVMVEIPSGLRALTYKLSPGTVMGIPEFITGRADLQFGMIAHTDLLTASIPADTLLRWCHAYSDFSLEICHRLLVNMYQTNMLFAECIGTNLYRATTTYLLYLYELYHKSYAKDYTGPVRIEESRQNMADFLGADVRSINRAIERLKGEGHISVIRGKIYIDAQENQQLKQVWEDSLP